MPAPAARDALQCPEPPPAVCPGKVQACQVSRHLSVQLPRVPGAMF